MTTIAEEASCRFHRDCGPHVFLDTRRQDAASTFFFLITLAPTRRFTGESHGAPPANNELANCSERRGFFVTDGYFVISPFFLRLSVCLPMHAHFQRVQEI
jgi:hypothetical protein